MRADIRTHLCWLTRRIVAVGRHLHDAIQADEACRDREPLLRSVPRIGPVVSHTLLADLPELRQLNRRSPSVAAPPSPITATTVSLARVTFSAVKTSSARTMCAKRRCW